MESARHVAHRVPFKWTATVDSIFEKLARLSNLLCETGHQVRTMTLSQLFEQKDLPMPIACLADPERNYSNPSYRHSTTQALRLASSSRSAWVLETVKVRGANPPRPFLRMRNS